METRRFITEMITTWWCFSYVEGAVEVSVLSEEDYDTSGSPMNGTYTRS